MRGTVCVRPAFGDGIQHFRRVHSARGEVQITDATVNRHLSEGGVFRLQIRKASQSRDAVWVAAAVAVVLRLIAFAVRLVVEQDDFFWRGQQSAVLEPDALPVRIIEHRGKFNAQFRATLNGGKVILEHVGIDGVCVNELVEMRAHGVPTHDQVLARADTKGHLGEVVHTDEDAVAPLGVAGTLPFGQPIAGKGQPVWADADARGEIILRHQLLFVRRDRHGLTHGVKTTHGGVSLQVVAHDVADAFVRGQVIIEAPMGILADAGFLGTVTPFNNIMPRA